MAEAINETGNRYGKLLVLEFAGLTRYGMALWLCECECGNRRKVAGANLRRGHTTSCGCGWVNAFAEYNHTRKRRNDNAKNSSNLRS